MYIYGYQYILYIFISRSIKFHNVYQICKDVKIDLNMCIPGLGLPNPLALALALVLGLLYPTIQIYTCTLDYSSSLSLNIYIQYTHLHHQNLLSTIQICTRIRACCKKYIIPNLVT